MLNDNALELAIDQFISLQQEIFDTLDYGGDVIDLRDHYFVLNSGETKVEKCSPSKDFPKHITSKISPCDKVIRRGNVVIVVVEPHEYDDSTTNLYIFSAPKEIKEG